MASGSRMPFAGASALNAVPFTPRISYQNLVTARSVGTVNATATLPTVEAASTMTVSGTSRRIG